MLIVCREKTLQNAFNRKTTTHNKLNKYRAVSIIISVPYVLVNSSLNAFHRTMLTSNKLKKYKAFSFISSPNIYLTDPV